MKVSETYKVGHVPLPVFTKFLLYFDRFSSGNDLGKVIEILKGRCQQAVLTIKDDEVEIDVCALESECHTFRYLCRFVDMCNPAERYGEVQ